MDNKSWTALGTVNSLCVPMGQEPHAELRVR